MVRDLFFLRFLLWCGPRSCYGFYCDWGFILVEASAVARASFLLQSAVVWTSCLLWFLLWRGLHSCYGFHCDTGFVLVAVFTVRRDLFLLWLLLW